MLAQAAMSALGAGATAQAAMGALGTAWKRFYTNHTELKKALADIIPQEQEKLKAIKKAHGAKVLDHTTVEKCIGGMRGITGLLWETSLLDAEEGIRFRGYSIPELQALLPGAKPGGQPLPEALMWLLLTGKVPTPHQTASITEDLRSRSAMPGYVRKVLEALPDGTHPMTQFSTGVLALQKDSKFAAAYATGIHKARYWDVLYEDALDLIAKLPELAAMIYRRTYKGGQYIPPDPKLDWAANLGHMMGYDEPGCLEMMRMYQTIHADHEGGNVSAHTTHLVGSALSDPYLSFSAGLNGLAGPLHGLANQEVLKWLKELEAKLGASPTKDELRQYVQDTLASGKVVPGYGHAVLRKTDPRYTCQREFALQHLPDYPLFKTVSALYEVVPEVLLKTGKVKNPWPNVDAHSGVLLQYYNITEENYYTVLFGVSRAIGVLSQLILSRALGLPIERPKSITMEAITAKFGRPA